jgi:hypothetical protein
VRDEKILPLEDAVRKATSAVATRLSIPDRGLLREGFFADIAVFDPNTIIDRSTFEQPHTLSEGVRFVFVNGAMVVRDGRTPAPSQDTCCTGQEFGKERNCLTAPDSRGREIPKAPIPDVANSEQRLSQRAKRARAVFVVWIGAVWDRRRSEFSGVRDWRRSELSAVRQLRRMVLRR